MQRFRGGLIFKTHGLVYHSTLDLRVLNEKKQNNLKGFEDFPLKNGSGQGHNLTALSVASSLETGHFSRLSSAGQTRSAAHFSRIFQLHLGTKYFLFKFMLGKPWCYA